MGRETSAHVMLVLISAIVVITLVLWTVEKVMRRRTVRSGFRRWAGFDDGGRDESDDDPYDVGTNDRDVL